MLKAQALSRCLGNEDFIKWVASEQNGYDNVDRDNIPSYRIVPCGVKVDLSGPFQKYISNFDVPIDGIQDKKQVPFFSQLPVMQSIAEVESLSKNSLDGHLTAPVPAFAYSIVNSLFPDYQVVQCWRHICPSELCAIVDVVKSKLMNFILMFCDEGTIEVNPDNFSHKDVVQKIFNQTINNSIVHNGNGDIDVNESLVGSTNTFSSKDISELKSIISQIADRYQSLCDDDIQEEIANIRLELNKQSPDAKFLRKAFRFIGGIASGVVANSISPLVNEAISIITSHL